MTLGNVPASDWDALKLAGVDAVWLLGVWQRSPAGRQIALDEPFRSATVATLPDETDDDVVGSAFCIRGYDVDEHLGGNEGLAAARDELAKRGLQLVLDFVPNHVAPDHPWVEEHPEYFIRGTEADLAAEPRSWLETSHGPVARGKDPNFPPWYDVVQLDPRSPGLRDAVVETLVSIGRRADGVRCDMAMLMLDDVVERTWGDRASPPRPEPYWVEVTGRVREEAPSFTFLAEAYWDLEGRLFEDGIDLCYDKVLYDRLVHGDAAAVRSHLVADPAWQAKLVRFLENHDEPRAAATFPTARGRAAAVALMTLPGVPLLFEGELEGRRVRTPMHLGRSPVEPRDEESVLFWDALLAVLASEGVRTGSWRLVDVDGWPDNRSCERLLAWRWDRHVVVVNYSDGPADGLVRIGPDLAGAQWRLRDVIHDEVFERDGDDIAARGLYVRLDPYDAYVLRLDSA